MLFDDMTWMDVEHYLETHDNRVVVITGACEQHAYLSLMTDIRAPLSIAQAACQREKVAIAPPLPFGVSPYFEAYPGTISLSVEVFAAVVREVIDQLVAQGFRRVLVSNGHGGNTGILRPLLIEMGRDYGDAEFRLFEWWRDPLVEAVAGEAGLTQRHANWSESLFAARVGPLPNGVKDDPDFSRTAPPDAVREALGDGSFGGAYAAPDDVIEKMYEAGVRAMVLALRGFSEG